MWTSAFLAFTVVVPSLSAQIAPCRGEEATTPRPPDPRVAWEAPLDRSVTLDLASGSVAQALDALSHAANVRFSYSPEVIAADRPVCLVLTSVALGDALRAILHAADSGHERTIEIRPTVADVDHVVLAPAPAPRFPLRPDPSGQRVFPLERIVVTGEPGALATRGISHSTQVIDAEHIAALGARDLGGVLAATVPGFAGWASHRAPGGRGAGVRGASSFSGGAPVIYLDGIRVADPYSLSGIAPEAVERIDVIRGPAGALLYGADAMDGVISIRSRRGSGTDATGLLVRSNAGLASAGSAREEGLSLDQVAVGWFGSPTRSARFSLGGGTKQDGVSRTANRYLTLTGSGQAISGSKSLAATARIGYQGMHAGGLSATIVPGTTPISSRAPERSDFSGLQGQRTYPRTWSYTFGAVAMVDPSGRWSHSLLLGVDGYTRSGTFADSFSRGRFGPSGVVPAKDGAATRLTFRGTSVFDAITSPDIEADLSIVADYSRLEVVESETTAFARTTRETRGLPITEAGVAGYHDSHGSAGAAVHVSASVHDHLTMDGGIRFQANDWTGPGIDIRALPMLGASLRVERGPFVATARTAWGTGVRPANVWDLDAGSFGSGHTGSPFAIPEETQTGLDTGLELVVADRLTVAVTRFHQRATGPIQASHATGWSTSRPEPGTVRESAHGARWERSGEITNTGWEVTTLASAGPLSLRAALTTVDSRVTRLPGDYAGTLRPGDRMPFVPATTAGFEASWSAERMSLSFSGSKAWDWSSPSEAPIPFLTESAFLSNGSGSPRESVANSSPYATRLDASASFLVRPGFSILLGVDNLLGVRRPESDLPSLLPRRNFSIGLRATF